MGLLPHQTYQSLLVRWTVDGGLGIPKLELVAVSSSLKAGLRFLDPEDLVMRALGRGSGLELRLRTQASTVRLNWP